MTKSISLTRKTSKYLASTGLVIAACSLVMAGSMPILNAILLIPFATLLYFLSHIKIDNNLWLALVLIPTIILGFFIAVFRPKGFDYPLVWATPALYEGGKAFSLHANIGKAAVGYLVLIWLLDNFTKKNTVSALLDKKTILLIAACIFSVMAIAILCFDINWQPKISRGLIYFAFINLLITVVSEEAFFRLLLHNHIVFFFSSKKTGAIWAVVITTLLFTLSHTKAFDSVFFLYLLAGFLYAFSYAYTKRLSVCVSLHFGVNICHFIFLEYPL